MYPNLRAELARRNMTIQELADKAGINRSTMYQKMSGEFDFFYKECLKIKNALQTEIPIEVLFSTVAVA